MNWVAGLVAGAISWIGGILILLGVYSIAEEASGGILLAGLGLAFVFFGEGLNLLKKRRHEEIVLLRENILGSMIGNMAFPSLWLLIYLLSGMWLLLAFGVAMGARALVKNMGLAAIFYSSS